MFAIALGRSIATIFARRYCSQQCSILKTVNPYSNVTVSTNYDLIVKPYDVLECQDSNLLRVSFHSKNNEKIDVPDFSPSIDINNENVDINTGNKSVNAQNNFSCLIEVPVKSNLKIVCGKNVAIEQLHGEEIFITSKNGNIQTKNIQSVNLNLLAENGNVRCDGTTLAHKVDVQVFGDKKIDLNKIQGDFLKAQTESGRITTECCYSEESKFVTNNGELQLKNIHKSSEISLTNGGKLNATGFHGKLQVKSSRSDIDLQLTEIYGESSIEANDPKMFNVNISDLIEEHSCISAEAKEIQLQESLSHLSDKLSNNTRFSIGNPDLVPDILTIKTNGNLQLGKMSWMDTIKMKFPSVK